jgi:hypothetical protein
MHLKLNSLHIPNLKRPCHMYKVWSDNWLFNDSVSNMESTDSLNLEQTYILEWWLCSEPTHKKREHVYLNRWPSVTDLVPRRGWRIRHFSKLGDLVEVFYAHLIVHVPSTQYKIVIKQITFKMWQSSNYFRTTVTNKNCIHKKKIKN